MFRCFSLRMLAASLIASFAAMLVAGCAPAGGDPKPPDIAYGQDVCDRCGMVIDDPQFAAATLLEDGAYLRFDDVGEMLMYHQKNTQVAVRAWFVHDYDTQEWLRGEQAFFVKSADLKTPMGMGIAAFASREAAEKLAAEFNGRVLTLDELLNGGMMEKSSH